MHDVSPSGLGGELEQPWKQRNEHAEGDRYDRLELAERFLVGADYQPHLNLPDLAASAAQGRPRRRARQISAR
jgi:hypothetical protein